MNRIPPNTEYDVWDMTSQKWYYPDHDVELTLVGNCANIIDWTIIVDQLKELPTRTFKVPTIPNALKMIERFTAAGYKTDDPSITWINYYANEHYDEKINQMFGKFVGHTRYARAWISRVNPGATVPWHWDVDDGEQDYISKGELIRFTCSINKHSPGQVTVIGNQLLYNGNIGDVYQWPDYRMWHGSVNCGLEPKFQFNYLAYKDE